MCRELIHARRNPIRKVYQLRPNVEEDLIQPVEETFTHVLYHRLRYFLTPQLDLYQNIARTVIEPRCQREPIWVADYGCGNGFGTITLWRKNCTIFGIDTDRTVVQFANDILGHLVKFEAKDWLRGKKDPQQKFDAIVCIEVIEHVPKPDQLLAAIRSRLKPNGLTIISTLNHNSQYRKNRSHVGKFCVADFRSLLRRFFGTVKIVDYTLISEIRDESSVTPMVAVCQEDAHEAAA